MSYSVCLTIQFLIRWRGVSKVEKQKYLDYSEEDKKRYKRQVCEMTEKQKPAKTQRKKKLLTNAIKLEKTVDDLIQFSEEIGNNHEDNSSNRTQLTKQGSTSSKQEGSKSPLQIYGLSRTGSSRKPSYMVVLYKEDC